MPLDQGTTTQATQLQVPGMTCAGCMLKVERCLTEAQGVLSARANLSQHRVAVRFDPALATPEMLIGALDQAGYEARLPPDGGPDDAKDQVGRELLLRLGVAGFAAMNVMLLSIGVWSGADAAMRDLLHWVSALIALPAMAYAGMPFYRNARSALVRGRLNMDVPISLAIALSAASSLFEAANNGQHAYFDAGIMLIFFLLVGRYLEHRGRVRARSAAAEMMAMMGTKAVIEGHDGTRRTIATEEIEVADCLIVAPGQRVPADGTVLRGASDLDRSMLTGESVPVPTEPGDAVHAGMLNLSGEIAVRVTRPQGETVLAGIAAMVDAAQHGRGRYDQIADRAARIYAPGVHLMAALAWLGWMLATGDARLATQIAVAVLIITCPCALALAVPTVHTMAGAVLFGRGIFLRDGSALERLAEIDTVVFDKTGTLTDGTPRVTDAPAKDAPAWALAMAMARGSGHPYAKAVMAAAQDLGVQPAPVTDLTEHPGLGIEATLDGERVRMGRPGWAGHPAGNAALSVQMPDGSAAGFTFAERLRPDTKAVCKALEQADIGLEILSGDSVGAVGRIAASTGIAATHAGLLPQDKHAHVAELAEAEFKVLMVGDGLNDNPALAAAHVSMSPSAAMDATQAVADLVFAGQSLRAVTDALAIAKLARRRALQSIGLALAYNAVALPMAMAGMVTPMIAALAMSGSSILVVANAVRMRAPA